MSRANMLGNACYRIRMVIGREPLISQEMLRRHMTKALPTNDRNGAYVKRCQDTGQLIPRDTKAVGRLRHPIPIVTTRGVSWIDRVAGTTSSILSPNQSFE